MGANLRRYHFDLGDSTAGPVGITVRINAFDKQSAVRRLRAILPDQLDLTRLLGDHRGATEHVTLHLNVDAIQASDIYDHEFV